VSCQSTSGQNYIASALFSSESKPQTIYASECRRFIPNNRALRDLLVGRALQERVISFEFTLFTFGDVTGDGYVGIGDLTTVLGNWNIGRLPEQISCVIPEPVSLMLLAMGSLVVLRRHITCGAS